MDIQYQKFSSTFRIAGLSSVRTLVYLYNPSAAGKQVGFPLEVHITNEGNVAEGVFSTNQQLGFAVHRISLATLGSPTVTVGEIQEWDKNWATSSMACYFNVTAGEPTWPNDDTAAFIRRGVPSLSGFHWESKAPGEFALGTGVSAVFAVRLVTTPTAFNCLIEMVWGEYNP